jgi:hypothetical protein
VNLRAGVFPDLSETWGLNLRWKGSDNVVEPSKETYNDIRLRVKRDAWQILLIEEVIWDKAVCSLFNDFFIDSL